MEKFADPSVNFWCVCEKLLLLSSSALSNSLLGKMPIPLFICLRNLANVSHVSILNLKLISSNQRWCLFLCQRILTKYKQALSQLYRYFTRHRVIYFLEWIHPSPRFCLFVLQSVRSWRHKWCHIPVCLMVPGVVAVANCICYGLGTNGLWICKAVFTFRVLWLKSPSWALQRSGLESWIHLSLFVKRNKQARQISSKTALLTASLNWGNWEFKQKSHLGKTVLWFAKQINGTN